MSDILSVINEVKKAVYGKDEILIWVMLTMMARGHLLLEDVPGVGKTTLALAFSKAIGLEYGRVQFTPDVLPSDITGYSLYQKESGKMVYQPGVILCNLFLADELNRATSRTQSALLEAMEEGQVTVDGISHAVPQPFTVIATQNPTGAAGTQKLPDSQIDRFMIRLSMGYPDAAAEREMLLSHRGGKPLDQIEQKMGLAELRQLQEETDSVYMAPELADYLVQLVDQTRNSELLDRGASPRATLAVASMAKALARASDRDYILPKDIQAVFCEVLAHRMHLSALAEGRNMSAYEVLKSVLKAVPTPKYRKK